MEHDFPKNQFARHSAELLGATEGPPKLPKHYHVTQCVATLLFEECEDDSHTPEMGTWESTRLPKLQSSITGGQNTLH